MNKDNVQKAINIMTRVKLRGDAFNMEFWQAIPFDKTLATEEDELHDCGSAACFAGWVAVSPEWKADGGTIRDSGQPEMGHHSASHSIAVWLGIDWELAHDLCGMGDTTEETDDDHLIDIDTDTEDGLPINLFYKKLLDDVTPQDVIDKLQELLNDEDNAP